MAGIARQLLGDDIKLLQSMALLKPPGTGEKRWHQDNAYFRLIPNKVMVKEKSPRLVNCHYYFCT